MRPKAMATGPGRPVRIAAAILATVIATTAGAEPPVVPPPAPVPEAFGDWRLICAADCRIETDLRAAPPRTGALLRLSVAAADRETLVIRTPLPLFLPDGLRLAPRDTDPTAAPWVTCGAMACEARLVLDPSILAALRKQPSANLELTLLDGSHARLPVSLRGFTAAYRALEARAPKISPRP